MGQRATELLGVVLTHDDCGRRAGLLRGKHHQCAFQQLRASWEFRWHRVFSLKWVVIAVTGTLPNLCMRGLNRRWDVSASSHS